MSDARQHVVRGPNLTGWGNRPSRTPCHHVERQIGMRFKTCGSRSRAAEFSWCFVEPERMSMYVVVPTRMDSFGGA